MDRLERLEKKIKDDELGRQFLISHVSHCFISNGLEIERIRQKFDYGAEREVLKLGVGKEEAAINVLTEYNYVLVHEGGGISCYTHRGEYNDQSKRLVILFRETSGTLVDVRKGVFSKPFADSLSDPKYLLATKSGSLFFSPFIIDSIPKFRQKATASVQATRVGLNQSLLDGMASKDNNDLFQDIAINFEVLAKEKFDLYSDHDDRYVNTNQPVWDMENPLSEQPMEEDSRHNDVIQCKGWRIEHLAYYVPAHSGDLCRYGVHLTKRGIAHIANAVYEECKAKISDNENLKEVIILATIHKLYAHEVCHAWIEYLCCLLDFGVGVGEEATDRVYAKTNTGFNSYIYMEEAICNTFAYGLLGHYLTVGDRLNSEDKEVIMDAFDCVMRRAPKGYCDFLAIPENPAKSKIFQTNVMKLLVEIYDAVRWKHLEERIGIEAELGSLDKFDVRGAIIGLVKLSLESLGDSESDWVAGQPPLFIEY